MSKENKENLPPEWVQDKLSALRKKLEQSEDWPERADMLLADLNQPAQLSSVGEADYQVLSLVVNDALEGVDITVQYPNFYRKLLADAELRQAFLDALAILSGDAADELDLLPNEFSHDLGFLQTAVSPPPIIRQTFSEKWQAAWYLLAEQLNQNFFQLFQPVYRSNYLLESSSVVLLHNDFTLSNRQYDVTLEAVSPLDAPEQLRLILRIIPLTDGPLPMVTASLQWGNNVLTAVLDRYGRAQFPLVPLASVLNEAGSNILSDLRLSLEIG